MRAAKILIFIFAMGYLVQLITRAEIDHDAVANWEKVIGLVVIVIVGIFSLTGERD